MKKILITILMISLICTPIFANPKPANRFSGDAVFGIISVITLGLGYVFYKVFTNDDKVEFTNEVINISVNEDNIVDVEGIYYFKRTGNSIQSFEIFYPFPKQKKYGEIEIESLTVNDKEVKYHQFELKRYNRISLNLYFNDSDKCKLMISFKQKPQDSSYKYILKSTKKWKQELEESKI